MPSYPSNFLIHAQTESIWLCEMTKLAIQSMITKQLSIVIKIKKKVRKCYPLIFVWEFKKRSGLNLHGSGNVSGSEWMFLRFVTMLVPTGNVYPSIAEALDEVIYIRVFIYKILSVFVEVNCRPMMDAGGCTRNVSFMTKSKYRMLLQSV